MARLSYQSIVARCEPYSYKPFIFGPRRGLSHFDYYNGNFDTGLLKSKLFSVKEQQPMIVPFQREKLKINGKSFGASAASYDVRLAHDLTLGPHPGYVLREIEIIKHRLSRYGLFDAIYTNNRVGIPNEALADIDKYYKLQDELVDLPLNYSLGYTEEDFYIPNNISADVADKSTYARLFVSCFNTFIDPGFTRANLTLEIVNLSKDYVRVKSGDPICQIIFSYLDESTERPYSGKYSFQEKRAVGPRMENEDGTFVELGIKEVKSEDAVALGSKGGKARAEALSPERRTEIARKAAKARWGKNDK